MSTAAIIVEGISKKYRIGHKERPYQTFREAATSLLSAPLKRLGRSNGGCNAAGDFYALKDVSFEVQPGEVVGIIGRNGAGKSTLLKILSRITEPTAGEVRLRGRVASLLEVGTGFHPELTGRENIYLNGAILGMKRAEITRKFDEIVAFAEVERFLDTAVKYYSSGMYVRLAFAVAAHLEPEILIVDEVLAVGDTEFQQKCLGKMQQVSEGEGRTVLFVSHNLGSVQRLCNRAVLLCGGQMAMYGDVGDTTEAYLSLQNIPDQMSVDLSSSSARMSGMSAIIRHIRILRRGVVAAEAFAGEPLEVEITLEAPRRIRDPRMAITFADMTGQRIMTMASYLSSNVLQDIKGTSVVRCVIPSLRVGTGTYLLGASVGTKADGLMDSIDHAVKVSVVWNDPFDNGEPYLRVFGPVIGESLWTS